MTDERAPALLEAATRIQAELMLDYLASRRGSKLKGKDWGDLTKREKSELLEIARYFFLSGMSDV